MANSAIDWKVLLRRVDDEQHAALGAATDAREAGDLGPQTHAPRREALRPDVAGWEQTLERVGAVGDLLRSRVEQAAALEQRQRELTQYVEERTKELGLRIAEAESRSEDARRAYARAEEWIDRIREALTDRFPIEQSAAPPQS